MTDTLSKEERSRVMAKVKSRDTKPEKKVRSLLFSLGFRFRLCQKNLPGKPDIVLKKIQNRHFRSWLFLARARKLQKRPHSQKQRRILEKQNRIQ